MTGRTSPGVGAVALGAVLALAGCSATPGMPEPPSTVGENYPGTCTPPQFSWPSDFIESLPGEIDGVGTIVGLRLEYLDDGSWAWRIRSPADREDLVGERVDDSSAGRDVLVDVQTFEVIASQEVELTDAEQGAANAYAAAQASGEAWPSPLIVEMARVNDGGAAVWRLTMCDTATNELSVVTAP
ncbi:hypothetical protein [Streptomyces sp. AC495_CC817]|uniref:hypothetical protein n=1 Tax=Streptomyces sp. AC495_CC817 TaxID=2823900 RepID=UPI001C27BAC7|nr:hypothetical protein [Streptomyces sp. AC495_CC817]